jgi:hypothetical protein
VPHDVCAQLQKFTLSVLHGSFHEAGAREILEVTQLRLAVLELFLVIAVLPDETQPTLAQGKSANKTMDSPWLRKLCFICPPG